MTIYLDPYGLRVSSTGEFIVTDDATYVEARKRMLAYRRGLTHAEPAIVVRDSVRANWFYDVETQAVQPRQQLQSRYPAVQLPADLTDEDVLTLNLLGSALSDADIEPTESALLKLYFGNRLSRHLAAPAALLVWAQFVVDTPDSFWKAYQIRRWDEKLTTTDTLYDKILIPIQSRNKVICRALVKGMYLAGWPSLLDDWLHAEAVPIKNNCSISEAELRSLLEQLPQPTHEHPALENQIEQQGINLLKKAPTAWHTWPGRYRAELRAIIAVGTPVNEIELTALLTTYANLLTPDLRHDLRALLPPTLTEAPALAGLSLAQQAAAWQRWAVEHFIPYKFWLDELHEEKRPDEALQRVERLSDQYADWLYENYQTLLDRDDILCNQQVRSRVADVSAEDRVIWLIIDGFPAAFVPLLHNVLSEQGLNRYTTDWSFAPLPTITPIGVPVLLNGLRPDAQSFVWDDNRRALEQSFTGKQTVFEAAIRKFRDTLQRDADVICLHWQEIDELLHKPDHKLAQTRTEAVEELLRPQIKQIADAINQSTRKTRLLIATDHGATKCLRNRMGIRNVKLAEAAADRPKERCLKLGGKLKPEYVDETESRLLPSSMTHNPDEWMVAWGYRYFGTNDHGYRHGGLTPEETIIPVIVAEVAEYAFAAPQILNVTGKGLILGNREKAFTIQLRNPNEYPVVVQKLVITQDPGCQFELPTTISSQETIRLTASLRLDRSEKPRQDQLPLNLTAVYEVKGDIHMEQHSLNVAIQSNELDDFFDF